jgi:hypothetical protein
MTLYLEATITEAKRTEIPRWGLTAEGYSLRSGAPTSVMVRLDGERRWRRLMVWQFSNSGTLFVRLGGIPYVVLEYRIPTIEDGG